MGQLEALLVSPGPLYQMFQESLQLQEQQTQGQQKFQNVDLTGNLPQQVVRGASKLVGESVKCLKYKFANLMNLLGEPNIEPGIHHQLKPCYNMQHGDI